MEHYLALRIGHSVPAVLLMLGLLAHIVIVWRAKGKKPEILQEKLYRTRVISLPVFTLLAVSVPITGWWMTHLSGLPLSQKWLMLSIALLPLIFIFGAFLYSNLSRWQLQLINKEPTRGRDQIFAVIWAVLILIVLLAISALMGAKPGFN
ncbi:DUF2269 family protein [Denitrificimonas sp. JX-1]|uniref:DUF2269 family protein n=1 Tax=Denitrificimonas halotolerans TaxID=3098930 RepID=A0ABU5GN81_9GAMM|nr:DUF2269 family protein [Denitrificimonas sp. JX-1]MDY7218433.1 DUF2269 family protein [Denitrificimonas sp. JX-1]